MRSNLLVPFTEPLLQFGAPAAVFGAALLGSGHCATMCGPLVFASRLQTHASRVTYHLARLLVYAAFGALAGGMGASLLSDPLTEVTGALATLLAASVALTLLIRPMLQWVSPRLLRNVTQPRPTRPGEAARAASLGLATAFLPCGWLHLFVGVSAASGSAARGAILLFVFGLGTVPSLGLTSELLTRMNHRVGRRWSQKLATVFLVLALAASLTLKLKPLLPAGADTPGATAEVCH